MTDRAGAATVPEWVDVMVDIDGQLVDTRFAPGGVAAQSKRGTPGLVLRLPKASMETIGRYLADERTRNWDGNWFSWDGDTLVYHEPVYEAEGGEPLRIDPDSDGFYHESPMDWVVWHVVSVTAPVPVDLADEIREWSGDQARASVAYDDAEHDGDRYEMGKAEERGEEICQRAVALLDRIASLI